MKGSAKQSLALLSKYPHFLPLIQKHGPPVFGREKNVFQALVRAIIYQQISGKAASTIFQRFCDLFPGGVFPTPGQVLKISPLKLRSAGLSTQKVLYVRDLAEKFSDGTIDPSLFDRMRSDEIIAHLTQIKGVGVWTVQMFLIFTLKRLDVLPTGDLGIRKGFQKVYRLRTLPDSKKMEKLAKPWREHASVASWYLWRVSDEGSASRKK